MTQDMMCSETISTLAKAMLEVHRQLMPVTKDKVNTFKGSNYASFAAVMEGCREFLLDAGIWLIQYPIHVDSQNPMLGLVTKLVHAESGEWQSSLLTIPVSKDDPQAFGSALTYARRYGLCALVGIVTEDDDGYVASPGTQKKQVRPSPQKQLNSQPSYPEGNQQDISQRTDLPKIDGVNYSQKQNPEGQCYIVASGQTRNKNQILKSAGFRWHPDNKVWWKHAS